MGSLSRRPYPIWKGGRGRGGGSRKRRVRVRAGRGWDAAEGGQGSHKCALVGPISWLAGDGHPAHAHDSRASKASLGVARHPAVIAQHSAPRRFRSHPIAALHISGIGTASRQHWMSLQRPAELAKPTPHPCPRPEAHPCGSATPPPPASPACLRLCFAAGMGTAGTAWAWGLENAPPHPTPRPAASAACGLRAAGSARLGPAPHRGLPLPGRCNSMIQ